MLLSLTIRNIALVEQLTISLHQGLHVLTGETGAGKSIVVDAVNLVLGGRADRELIRTGSDKAFVEALFDIQNNQQVHKILEAQELEVEGDLLSISREITAAGRNICRICGVVMPLSILKELTTYLMDVHGQHEHQFLMDEKRHLHFLDGFGNADHQACLEETAKAYTAWREGSRAYSRLSKESALRDQRMDTLRLQLEELRAAKLKPGEEEDLQKERELLRHGEKITHAMSLAYGALYEAGENGRQSALTLLRGALVGLEPILSLNPEYQALYDRLNGLYYEIEDVGISLRNYQQAAEFDPERNEEILERLDVLRRLQRKYGKPIAEMLDYQEMISAEYGTLEHLDESLEKMRTRQKQLQAAYRKEAARLSQSRKTLAAWFEQEMMAQLSQLGMGKTQFSVVFKSSETGKPVLPQEMGDDDISFFIAPNPGEPLKPLAKIASGGELSRLMLALKSIAVSKGGVAMVFDEIDTGISGKIAQVVAEKMAGLAAYRQVICVTHLPQIAAMADYHYLVEKAVTQGRTRTDVIELEIDGRVRELARMIGGTGEENDSGVLHAQHMLQMASDYKKGASPEKNRNFHKFV